MVKTETDMCFQQFFSEILLFQQEIMKKCEKNNFYEFGQIFPLWATFSYEIEFL